VAALLFDVCCRNDLRREMEPFTEVVETLRGKGVVVPLPGELRLKVATGCERLAGFDYLAEESASVGGAEGNERQT
jgi:hypothetical protein